MPRPFPTFAVLALSVGLGSCVTPSDPPPAPPRPIPIPAPAPTPAPSPTPAPPPASAEWRDWPVTPGTWAYRQDERGGIALYGVAGRDSEFTLRCDRARRQVFVSRRAATTGAAQLTVRTSSTLRTLAMRPTGAEPAYLAVELAPGDTLLDAIGFSRGKFVVMGGGLPALVMPAWAEVLRVAEDCR